MSAPLTLEQIKELQAENIEAGKAAYLAYKADYIRTIEYENYIRDINAGIRNAINSGKAETVIYLGMISKMNYKSVQVIAEAYKHLRVVSLPPAKLNGGDNKFYSLAITWDPPPGATGFIDRNGQTVYIP